MGEIFEKAMAAMKALPDADRERISWEIIERLEDKSEWDRIVSSDASRQWLEKAARKALREHDRIYRHLTISHISIPSDNLLREGSYWKGFDELPEEVRNLAESNYNLWRENPNHPKLRFKQIHPDEPIFSFRVGLRHRTVGARARDDRLVWFWIGSFEQYEKMISQ